MYKSQIIKRQLEVAEDTHLLKFPVCPMPLPMLLLALPTYFRLEDSRYARNRTT